MAESLKSMFEVNGTSETSYCRRNGRTLHNDDGQVGLRKVCQCCGGG